MVTCKMSTCSKVGSFGVEGTRTAEFCATHAKEGMINVISKRCDNHGCSKHPSYGVAGSKKAEFCVAHALQGMVDVCSKRCGHPGCVKRSSYGMPGSKKPEFCIHHAMKGMIDVVSKRCAFRVCNKWPSYGVPGSKKAEFCAAHAKDGMVGVCNKRCAHPGCTKQPKYGVAGSKKREFCAPHAKGGMVDVYNKRCGYSGCTKGPSYGVAGSKKREFCAQHAAEGMVNVCSRKRARDARDARLALEASAAAAAAAAGPKPDPQASASSQKPEAGGVALKKGRSLGQGGAAGKFVENEPASTSSGGPAVGMGIGGASEFVRQLLPPSGLPYSAVDAQPSGKPAAVGQGPDGEGWARDLGANTFESQVLDDAGLCAGPRPGQAVGVGNGSDVGRTSPVPRVPVINSAEDTAVAELVMGLKNRRSNSMDQNGGAGAGASLSDHTPANNERSI
ncbi:unnamed protein product [Pylaiella littoralis]